MSEIVHNNASKRVTLYGWGEILQQM